MHSAQLGLHTVYATSPRSNGRPRMVQALRVRAHAVGHKRVARLMREEGLRGKAKGRFKPRITGSRHLRPVAATGLLARLPCTARCRRGSATSLTCQPGKAGCTWPRSSTCAPARFSVTAWPSACSTTWCSRPCSMPARFTRPLTGRCSTPTAAASTLAVISAKRWSRTAWFRA
ncbi:transposase [Xanthomonas theicola]|nr:transposase [Xanthomonas theicola]